MLILSRKPAESIVIDGQILIKVIRVEGEAVKLGIQAPAHISVHRQEVYEEIHRNNQEAALSPRPLSLKLPLPAARREQSPRAPVVPTPAAPNQNPNTANK